MIKHLAKSSASIEIIVPGRYDAGYYQYIIIELAPPIVYRLRIFPA
jgi:hypothetical protein